MTAQPQPQPPQQHPIYSGEFNFAMDKLFSRVTTYTDGQIEKLSVQMRIYNQEAIDRDEEAMRRDQDLAKLVFSFREESRKQGDALTQRMDTMQQQMNTMQQQMNAMLLHMNALHGEAMEAIHDLQAAVSKLQKNDE